MKDLVPNGTAASNLYWAFIAVDIKNANFPLMANKSSLKPASSTLSYFSAQSGKNTPQKLSFKSVIFHKQSHVW